MNEGEQHKNENSELFNQNILFRVSGPQTELIGGKILDIKSRREYEPLKVRQCYPMSK